jgi:putative redox protein
MVTIQTHYTDELRTEAEHLYSGTRIITDAPLDNQGKAESFSPTDLLAASLGSCMITVVGIAARTHGFEERLRGTKIDITKIMKSEPRRVGELQLAIYFPEGSNFDERERKIIEHTARNCPVAKSLHPDLIQTWNFNW